MGYHLNIVALVALDANLETLLGVSRQLYRIEGGHFIIPTDGAALCLRHSYRCVALKCIGRETDRHILGTHLTARRTNGGIFHFA